MDVAASPGSTCVAKYVSTATKTTDSTPSGIRRFSRSRIGRGRRGSLPLSGTGTASPTTCGEVLTATASCAEPHDLPVEVAQRHAVDGRHHALHVLGDRVDHREVVGDDVAALVVVEGQ